jgi:hypothetical protein
LELESALRPISDQLLRELDELAAVESEKRTLHPGDDRTVALAARARELAQRVLAASVVEEQVARTANEVIAEPAPTTAQVPEERPRQLYQILDEWREAERAIEAAPTAEAGETRRARAHALRDEYQRAFEALERQDATRRGQPGSASDKAKGP